jgi:heme/copper-type cytochrome/quinol oxidase subunit 1
MEEMSYFINIYSDYLDIQKCYIIILPAFGLISEAIIKEYKKEIFGKIGMIYAMGSIGLIGSLV